MSFCQGRLWAVIHRVVIGFSVGAVPGFAQDAPGQVPAEEDTERRSASYERLEAPVPSPEELKKGTEASRAKLEEQGVYLDLEGGFVAVRGATFHDRESLGYPIEYLIVTEYGRTHEAVFLIRARPQVLNNCLLAIGLEPGQGMRFEKIDPAPDSPAKPWVTHPASGPVVDLQVQWIDERGQSQAMPLESMLVDLETGEDLEGRGWIYVGSRMGSFRQGREMVERYMADVYGNIVAIYLDGQGNCLFERNTLEGVDRAYTIHPDRLPPRNTPVTLLFKPTDKSVAPREMDASTESQEQEGGAGL